MGAGGSKGGGSKLAAAAAESPKKPGASPTSLDAIAARVESKKSTSKVAPEPEANAPGSENTPPTNGVSEDGKARASSRASLLLQAADQTDAEAPPQAEGSPGGSDASEKVVQRRLPQAPMSPASSGGNAEGSNSQATDTSPSNMNRDPQRRRSWDRMKAGISGVLNATRRPSKEKPTGGSPDGSPGAGQSIADPEASPSQRSTPIVPLAASAEGEGSPHSDVLVGAHDDGLQASPTARTRYRIEPMLAFGGEQGRLEQLGSEVVFPAIPGIDLRLVAVNETPAKTRYLPGTANVKHAASSPACLVLHLGDGIFKIHKPSGETADLKLDFPGTVMAIAVNPNGGAIGIILEEEEVSYLALSLRSSDGTAYGAFQRSPRLPIRSTKIMMSKAGLAVCISDQVANFWSPAAGDALFDFVWSSDITCMAFFENDDPSFSASVGDRKGRILFGCSDLLEVKSEYTQEYTLASTHLTGRVSALVVLKNAVVAGTSGDNITVYDLSFTKLKETSAPCRSMIAWGSGEYLTYGSGLLQWGAWDANPKRYGALRVRDVAVYDAHAVLAGQKVHVYHCNPEPKIETELNVQASLVDVSVSGAFAMLCGESIEVRKGLQKRKITSPLASIPVEDAEKCCALSFSGEGHYLALAGDKIYIYSVAAGYALARVVDRTVEAIDWSRGERYMRLRAGGVCSAWDLKRNSSTDFDDKWVTATTALEENLASCFVGTDVAHAMSGGGFMIAADNGEDQVVLERTHVIAALGASRNALSMVDGAATAAHSPGGQSPRGTWRLLVSVSSQGTVIFWKSSLNLGFGPSPSVSPIPVSPMAGSPDSPTAQSSGSTGSPDYGRHPVPVAM